MEYLYVCLFSNGHIKVGRSIDPQSRIASHADRVACLGVELIAHAVFECVGNSAPAEADLIAWCAENAERRNKSEWFEGLDSDSVCKKALLVSQTRYVLHKSAVHRAIEVFDGSPTKMAAAMGGDVKRQHIEHWLKSGRVPPQHCQQVKDLTGIPVWELQPEDWHRIWPMLIASEGAPDPANQSQAATQTIAEGV